MNKIPLIGLWDTYKGLLTPTQQEITDLYFNLDLTLSEIAEQKGISRQGVSECLKTCKKQLEEYEEKLHFHNRIREACLEFSFAITDIGRWAEKLKANHPELSAEADELINIVNKDYSVEAKELLKNPEALEFLNKDYTETVFGRKKTGEE